MRPIKTTPTAPCRLKTQNQPVQTWPKQNIPLLMMLGAVIVFVAMSPAFGVDVEALQQPIIELKRTIFKGWMWIAKIGAAVGGCVMAVYQRDIIPMATGAAVGLGIHFYDGYFGEGAAGALI